MTTANQYVGKNRTNQSELLKNSKYKPVAGGKRGKNMYSKRLTGGKRGKTYNPPYQVALPRESAGKHATHLTMGKEGKAGNRLYQGNARENV